MSYIFVLQEFDVDCLLDVRNIFGTPPTCLTPPSTTLSFTVLGRFRPLSSTSDTAEGLRVIRSCSYLTLSQLRFQSLDFDKRNVFNTSRDQRLLQDPSRLYYTILEYTILYYNILYYTILYYTILSIGNSGIVSRTTAGHTSPGQKFDAFRATTGKDRGVPLILYTYNYIYIYIEREIDRYIANILLQYVYICICMYTYIYIYTHIHTTELRGSLLSGPRSKLSHEVQAEQPAAKILSPSPSACRRATLSFSVSCAVFSSTWGNLEIGRG